MYIEPHYEKNVFPGSMAFTNPQIINIAKSQKDLPRALDLFEKRLKENKTKYIAGNEPSVADYVTFHQINELEVIGQDLFPKRWPNIIKWLEVVKILRGNKEVYEKYKEQVE